MSILKLNEIDNRGVVIDGRQKVHHSVRQGKYRGSGEPECNAQYRNRIYKAYPPQPIGNAILLIGANVYVDNGHGQKRRHSDDHHIGTEICP